MRWRGCPAAVAAGIGKGTEGGRETQRDPIQHQEEHLGRGPREDSVRLGAASAANDL